MPAAAIEGEHLLAAEALAQRVSADEHLELPDQVGVAAELQVGIDPLLDACEVLLGEASAFLVCERLLELGEWRPAPELQRFAERRSRLARATGGERLASACAAASRTGAGRASGRRARLGSPADASRSGRAGAACGAARRRSAPSCVHSRGRLRPKGRRSRARPTGRAERRAAEGRAAPSASHRSVRRDRRRPPPRAARESEIPRRYADYRPYGADRAIRVYRSPTGTPTRRRSNPRMARGHRSATITLFTALFAAQAALIAMSPVLAAGGRRPRRLHRHGRPAADNHRRRSRRDGSARKRRNGPPCACASAPAFVAAPRARLARERSGSRLRRSRGRAGSRRDRRRGADDGRDARSRGMGAAASSAHARCHGRSSASPLRGSRVCR